MFISSAMAQTPGAAPSGGLIDMLIPMVLMGVVFYFLLIRPQNNARKKHAAMIAGIKRGDTVVTAAGFIGKVAKSTTAEDKEVLIEIADGVQVNVIKTTLSDVQSRTQPTEQSDKK